MNVGELLRERDRLLTVIEEAKSARSKLKQVNVLIAMYGDAEHIDLIKNDAVATNGKPKPAAEPLVCPECNDGKTYNGQRGLTMHNKRFHTGEIRTDREKAAKARKATKARKAS